MRFHESHLIVHGMTERYSQNIFQFRGNYTTHEGVRS